MCFGLDGSDFVVIGNGMYSEIRPHFYATAAAVVAFEPNKACSCDLGDEKDPLSAS